MKKEGSHLWIINPGVVGHTGQVFYVDEKGDKTDISNVITGFTINSKVGELTTAQIDVIKVKYALLAQEQ